MHTMKDACKQLSENPVIRMFAVLDRRVGKRTLERMKQELELQPDWLQRIYRLRLEAEKILFME